MARLGDGHRVHRSVALLMEQLVAFVVADVTVVALLVALLVALVNF